MGKGKNHNFVMQTRQKDDELFRLDSLGENPLRIDASSFAQLPIRRVVGYGVIRFLVVSTNVMVLRIEEAPTPDGPWVETERLPSVASPSGSGQSFICTDISPCGAFMRVFLDNNGPGPVTPDLIGFGHPVAGGGSSGGGSGGSGGNTIGTTIVTAPDAVVGIGATVALTPPPLGTLRMTIEVTGGDATTQIRVREVGGVDGRLLILLGSTMYGGNGGSIAPLEVENVAGPAATVSISFEVL